PSELFQRNCWISFEPVESSIAVLADYIGPHKIMWATDYPHQDGFFPGAPQMIRDRLGPLSAEARHQVMAGGALGFFGMNLRGRSIRGAPPVGAIHSRAAAVRRIPLAARMVGLSR